MSTLADISKQLAENSDQQKETNSILDQIRQSFSDWFVMQQGEGLRGLEDKIEQRNRIRGADGSLISDGVGSSKREVTEQAGFLSRYVVDVGRFIAPVAKAIGGLAGMLASVTKYLLPFGGLIKWVSRMAGGGLLLGGLFLAFDVLRDIHQNPAVQQSVESIRKTWNETIVPAWTKLASWFDGLLDTSAMSVAIAGIVEGWNNTVAAIQGFLGRTIEGLATAVGGIISGLSKFIDGDFVGGMETILFGLMNGVRTIFDGAITGIFNMFGINFGEDGTFMGWYERKFFQTTDGIQSVMGGMLTSIGERFPELTSMITGAWDRFTTFLSGKWTAFTDFLTVDIPAKFTEIKDSLSETFANLDADAVMKGISGVVLGGFENISNRLVAVKDGVVGMISSVVTGFLSLKDLVAANLDYYATKLINEFKISFEFLLSKFKNIPDQLYLLLAENFRFSFPQISVPKPKWLGGGEHEIIPAFEIGIGDQKSIQTTRAQIEARNQETGAAIEKLQSETAAALQRSVEALEQVQRAFTQTIVVNNVPSAPTPAPAPSGGGTTMITMPVETYDKHMARGNGIQYQWGR